MRRIKDIAKLLLFRIHVLFIHLGLFLLPVHYYVSTPNIVELRKSREVWAKKSDLPGITTSIDEQVSNLKAICLPFQKETIASEFYRAADQRSLGPGYGFIEGQALHCVVRHFKPQRIIEVGSGFSTHCIVKACELNRLETMESCEVTSIEPYPSQAVRNLSQIHLIEKQVQTVPTTIFEGLRENDFLFIDSSHTVKTGSDVNFLILEVLPRLHSGVIVHFHDIYLPYDYGRTADRTYLHWSETSLLHAFLIFNERARIIASLSMLHYECKDELKALFPEYSPQQDQNGLWIGTGNPFAHKSGHFPSSLYIQIRARP